MKFVLIGHVDHGKSTLGGCFLYKSNNINNRLISNIKNNAYKMKREKWWLAYILDTDDSERLMGKTYSMNIVSFEYQNKKYEIIDVPGHQKLVYEMIYGTAQADIAILVISIRDGEYEDGLSGQTLEHALIARGMGINSLIVCVNKMDTIDWDNDKYNHIVTDFTKKIKKFRFKHILFVPVSAYRGDNVMERYDDSLFNCSLIEALNSINVVSRKTKLIQPDNNKINGRFIFYHIENLITIGYVCKLHTIDELYDVEFVEIKNDKLPFVTQNNSQGKIINVILNLNTNDVINSNVILRDGNKTIAIGLLF